MKLCFINSCRGATDEFWKKAFAYILDHSIDTVVVRLQKNALFWTEWKNERNKYPQIRIFLLTHMPQERRKENLPEDVDGFWYPEGMEGKPARIARRIAGCLTIDQAACMVERKKVKTGLPRLLSAYGHLKQRMGETEVIQI